LLGGRVGGWKWVTVVYIAFVSRTTSTLLLGKIVHPQRNSYASKVHVRQRFGLRSDTKIITHTFPASIRYILQGRVKSVKFGVVYRPSRL